MFYSFTIIIFFLYSASNIPTNIPYPELPTLRQKSVILRFFNKITILRPLVRYVTISLAQSYKSCTWLTTRFGLHEVHRPQEKNRENYVFRRILKYYVWLEREQNWLSNGLFLFVAKLLSSK